MTTTNTRNTNAIVSFANKRGNYAQGIARLSDSLRDNSEGIDFLGFIGESSLGCKPHTEDNYAFKVAATQVAIDQGYTSILWLDASCFAIGQMQPIFDIVQSTGFIFQESGFMLGQWCNDRTLKYFGISRDEAYNIKLMGNAGLLGFDYSTEVGKEFWAMYSKSQQDGMFNGGWDDHRHDISCASACLYKLGLIHLIRSGDEILQYAGVFDKQINDSIIIKAQGL